MARIPKARKVASGARSWARLVLLCALMLTALPAAVAADGLSRAEAYRRAEAFSALGRKLFFDVSLSASGTMSCASCHSPGHAYGPPNDRAVQLGGAHLRRPGLRAVPSLEYLQAVPSFTPHFFDSPDEADESVDNGPTGGLTWDGRADRVADQAVIPLLSPFEMANRSAADVVEKFERAGYRSDLQDILGADTPDDVDGLFQAIGKALAVYQQDYRAFYPYSSKYDAYLAGTATLSAAEQRGLKLFEDPAKGNCASCHISRRGNDGTPPQLTDWGFIALGVPRNADIPANADPTFFDLGLCGPLRTDFADRADYCGLFRTPSLRNVATRHTFFHNGVFHSLRKVLEFYAQRDTAPQKWYPRDSAGRVRKFDDLPARYHANVNMDPPFGGEPGDPPALSDDEIDDVIAFLETLTDGYRSGVTDRALSDNRD